MILVFVLLALTLWPVDAAIQKVDWSIGYILAANPDGLFPRRAIGVNNIWPPPPIELTAGDQLQITAVNHLDGIPPGASFTYVIPLAASGQSGTFWIHGYSTVSRVSELGVVAVLNLRQGHADGLRAPVIVQSPAEVISLNYSRRTLTIVQPYRSAYDVEATVTLGDWYHQEYPSLLQQYISKSNPSGILPHPDSGLLYYSQNGAYLPPRAGATGIGVLGINENSTLIFTPGKRYRLRVVNVGVAATFYFWIDSHPMTVIEADGVAVQEFQTTMLSVFAGQRYSVLVTANQPAGSKYAVHANMDPETFGSPPASSIINITSSIAYLPQSSLQITNLGPVAQYKPIDDTALVPLIPQASPFPDVTIELNASFSVMSDGTNRLLFNQLTYNRPLVPALFSALSLANPAQASAYGPTTFVLASSKVYEILVNNLSGRMIPFHLHGHAVMITRHTTIGGSPVTGSSSNPSRRDVIAVRPGGSVSIRFTADNPGAWFRHNTFHLDAGLAVQLIEGVDAIQRVSPITAAAIEQCAIQGFPTEGNAAGHANPDDFSGWWLRPGISGTFDIFYCLRAWIHNSAAPGR
ncbi:Fet3 protein [Mycena vulgaris]|nr:Fet3 protein [Mycena vulgaris]